MGTILNLKKNKKKMKTSLILMIPVHIQNLKNNLDTITNMTLLLKLNHQKNNNHIYNLIINKTYQMV